MKKIIFSLGIIVIIFCCSAQTARAALIFFEPANVVAKEGEYFEVKIKINPQNVPVYMAKMIIEYSSELVEARSFDFGSGWVPLEAEVYNKIDNSRGIIKKAATYDKGISNSSDFGTIRFFAKQSDIGQITINVNSEVVDKDDNNLLTDSYPEAMLEVRPTLGYKNNVPKIDQPLIDKGKAFLWLLMIPFIGSHATINLILLVFVVVAIVALFLILRAHYHWKKS